MTDDEEIAELMDRIARLHSARRRSAALPEAQVAALDYLARANRFSRSPSAVAEYLAATRGTVSQTLIALARKGLVSEEPAPDDRRSRIYSLSPKGRAEIGGAGPSPDWGGAKTELLIGLRAALAVMIRDAGGRSFGLCRTCRHHRPGEDGAFCALLGVALAVAEADQICAEHQAA
ncbi:MAG TPA: MarR family transcriptional regulator [Albidovulum sp.]|uniref:MarR family winged helix-turn-helix transcriptional regulator n=1 Tax=Albidovulum sp. TaxID=1872424 RepID=UPI002BA5CDCA|nr:MarR family transcriptional regulator [Albidovulum sp.]